MTFVCGIDPGISGGIAFLDDTPDDQDYDTVRCLALDLPTVGENKNRRLDLHEIRVMLDGWRPDVAVLEVQQSMPGQGVSSMFKLGEAYGQLNGLCNGLDIKTAFVRPQAWKAATGILAAPKWLTASEQTTFRKHRSIEAASDLYPKHAWQWPLKKDNHRAEAVLIARYGMQMRLDMAQ